MCVLAFDQQQIVGAIHCDRQTEQDNISVS